MTRKNHFWPVKMTTGSVESVPDREKSFMAGKNDSEHGKMIQGPGKTIPGPVNIIPGKEK
ncbi:MAG: hypothetical protein PVH61_11485 [Candidatus Aminicenantes bacterium]